MRRFLKNTGLFAVIILLLLAVGEVVVRHLPNSYGYKHRWLSGHGGAVSTLVLGSSHTYYGVRSDILGDSVFNLANVSQTPDVDLSLLKYYDKTLPNLRRVIIPVSYFTFVDPRLEDGGEWFRCIGYKVSMGLPDHSDLSKYNFEISDFDGYRAKLQGLVIKQPSNKCDSLGWGVGYTLDSRPGDWEEQGAKRAEATTIPVTDRAGQVERRLQEIVDFCRARNVETVLVTTPVWHTYREHLDTAQLNDMYLRTKRLANRNGLKYINLFDSKEFVDEDFHDVDHLSDVGAEKFSILLKKALNR